MAESGNERQRHREDVPRGYSNIKGVSERGARRLTKLREGRSEVCVQLVGRFLRVGPVRSISIRRQKSALHDTGRAAQRRKGGQRGLTGSETSLLEGKRASSGHPRHGESRMGILGGEVGEG